MTISLDRRASSVVSMSPMKTPGAAALKKLREQAEFSRQHLADLLGVDRRSIARWENGQPIPPERAADLRFVLAASLMARRAQA